MSIQKLFVKVIQSSTEERSACNNFFSHMVSNLYSHDVLWPIRGNGVRFTPYREVFLFLLRIQEQNAVVF